MTNNTSREIRHRIRLSIAAYAFHIVGHRIMTDTEFNELERSIDPDMPTGNEMLDHFFYSKFSCNGGTWIRHHPHVTGLVKYTYEKYHKPMPTTYDQKFNCDLFGPILVEP